jgi:D-alanyl-D-alanine carboxypeptidase
LIAFLDGLGTRRSSARRNSTVACRAGAVVLGAAVASSSLGASAGRPEWKQRIDELVQNKKVGVAVRLEGRTLYRHHDKRRRKPASNQKLMLSMALLDTFEPSARLRTFTAARDTGRVVDGRLWVLGRGDPTLASGGRFARSLSIRPTYVGRLARSIKASGVVRIRGRVMGSTRYFVRDWDAPGWLYYYQELYIARPTALSVDGNTRHGRHILDPEIELARLLTKKLESIGVRVGGPPGSGPAPTGLKPLSGVTSAPLSSLMRYMDRKSSNFFAEMLGKRLAVERRGPPGSIAKGARAIASWAARHGVTIEAHDSSGLSHANRVSARGLVKLLDVARAKPWGPLLRRLLPGPGQGTLEGRLSGVRVRAKTGTLIGSSALSGFVWLDRADRWAEFSILSSDMDKTKAVAMENSIVRIVARAAH